MRFSAAVKLLPDIIDLSARLGHCRIMPCLFLPGIPPP
jgi:hypothetical protein